PVQALGRSRSMPERSDSRWSPICPTALSCEEKPASGIQTNSGSRAARGSLSSGTPAILDPIGPMPQHDPNNVSNTTGQDVTGRVSALALATIAGNQNALFLGAAGGGIWRSTDFAFAATPSWTRLTDYIGIQDPSTGLGAGTIDVGSILVVPG